MINITFPDGSVREFEQGITPFGVAESISPRFAADVLAAKVNGEEWDISPSYRRRLLHRAFQMGLARGQACILAFVSPSSCRGTSGALSGVKFGIGSAIENGFYYDIAPGEHKITSDDFPKIEKKMMELVAGKRISSAEILPRRMHSACSVTEARPTSASL